MRITPSVIRALKPITGAVLIIDVCHMKETVADDGIEAFLGNVSMMQDAVEAAAMRIIPIPPEEFSPRIVKFDGDNAYLLVATIDHAINIAVAVATAVRPMGFEISAGIAYGQMHVVQSDARRVQDFFGDPVNMACLAGEDMAGADELLIEEREVTPKYRYPTEIWETTWTRVGVRPIKVTKFRMRDCIEHPAP